MFRFFLTRPIFAAVLSAVILTAGIVAIPTLPIAQYPQISPPTISVTASYPGANAAQVESAVTTPIEEAINGAQGLRYISSTSGDDGTATITCTFDLSRNIDAAASDVLLAIQQANGRLPNVVKMTGVQVNKVLGSFVMALSLYSDDPKYDPIFLSNYASVQIIDALKRVPGVGQITIFGDRTYAMRLWLDPKKLADNGLTASDVSNALQQQNIQVPAGAFGSEPSTPGQPYYVTIVTAGQLTTPQEFDDIILKANPDGGYVKLSDVGYAQLGAQTYASVSRRNGQLNIGLGIQQTPSANALSVSDAVKQQMDVLSHRFPQGVHWANTYDTTDFVRASIREVLLTLVFAIVLVVVVIYIFLQDWRTTLIPAITIPVSLIGSFAVMSALGFSINTLTLFGITLVTGLVVDDAIVVIENIARFLQNKEDRSSPVEGASKAMDEIGGAVVATSLVLLAVFIPVGFFPGITGQLYRQFALTIAVAIAISLVVALTLTPALSVLLIKKDEPERGGIFRPINRAIAWLRSSYDRALGPVLRFRWAVLGFFIAALAVTLFLFTSTPTGFVPDEDLGYFFVTVQAPNGTSLGTEMKIADKVDTILEHTPGVALVFDNSGRGLGGTGNGSNLGFIIARLKPWGDRTSSDQQLGGIIAKIQPQLAKISGAKLLALSPPAIAGIGSVGGFQYELQDTSNAGLDKLSAAANDLIAQANQTSVIQRANTTFSASAPHLAVVVDRGKAESAGVSLGEIFGDMQAYLGSQYVNDFTYNNRAYRVYIQADAPFRSRFEDLDKVFVRAANGSISPITNYISTEQTLSPPLITHYNIFRNIEVTGQTPTGIGTGQSLQQMEQLSHRLPGGFAHEWSGISLEEINGGSASILLFGLGLLFVYFVLAAKYENLTQPFLVLLSTPVAILGALIGLHLRTLSSDVYAQVGYVMLIGLASKNAILIVEFANQLRGEGLDAAEAVRRAAEIRLRPILMTSLAFIISIAPLLFASGAGAASRHSLGTVVFGGMLVSTALNLFIIPPLYVLFTKFERKRTTPAGGNGGDARAHEANGDGDGAEAVEVAGWTPLPRGTAGAEG